MIPMDDLKKWAEKMQQENATDVLSMDELNEWNNGTLENRIQVLKELLEKPVAFASPYCVYRWYFRNKWGEALMQTNTSDHVSLLEIGSGSTDMLPKIISKTHPHPATTYVTVNANKKLTAEFRENTNDLPIKIEIVEDVAQNLETHFGYERFDFVAFEHSFNDIIEAMLGERNGLDTINSDWFEILPDMIKMTNKEYLEKTLESSVKEEFLELLSSCFNVLKVGGYIVVNHFQYQYDLDLGINPDFWENLLTIARKWIADSGMGQEVFFDGFEPQWWMFIKKV